MKDINHGVGVVVVRDDGAILLQHRDNNPKITHSNLWCFPGGRVEDGEDYMEAAKRELFEETNYRAYILKPFTEEDYTTDKGELVRRHVYWTLYDGKQKINCDEGQELKFISPDKFDKLKFVFGHKQICSKASQMILTSGSKSIS